MEFVEEPQLWAMGMACVFMLLDIVSGFVGALKNRCVNSSKMRDGIFNKAALLIVVFVAWLGEVTAQAVPGVPGQACAGSWLRHAASDSRLRHRHTDGGRKRHGERGEDKSGACWQQAFEVLRFGKGGLRHGKTERPAKPGKLGFFRRRCGSGGDRPWGRRMTCCASLPER